MIGDPHGFNLQIADYKGLSQYLRKADWNFLFGHGARVESVVDDFYELLLDRIFKIWRRSKKWIKILDSLPIILNFGQNSLI